jgi:hypothetical protein
MAVADSGKTTGEGGVQQVRKLVVRRAVAAAGPLVFLVGARLVAFVCL